MWIEYGKFKFSTGKTAQRRNKYSRVAEDNHSLSILLLVHCPQFCISPLRLLFFTFSGKPSEARDVLTRSLKSLPKATHIEAITQFALLEYK